jgi:hypothetical protein
MEILADHWFTEKDQMSLGTRLDSSVLEQKHVALENQEFIRELRRTFPGLTVNWNLE